VCAECDVLRPPPGRGPAEPSPSMPQLTFAGVAFAADGERAR